VIVLAARLIHVCVCVCVCVIAILILSWANKWLIDWLIDTLTVKYVSVIGSARRCLFTFDFLLVFYSDQLEPLSSYIGRESQQITTIHNLKNNKKKKSVAGY